jgi:hypothetical protein
MMLTPAVFPFGLLVLFDRRENFWMRWTLITWFVPFFVFYSFYGFFDSWPSVRFVLPAIPALILGALILVRDLRLALPKLPNVVAAMAAAALVLWMCITPLRSAAALGVFEVMPHMEGGYPQYIRFAESYLPKRCIAISGVLSGAFLYYADRGIVQYEQLDDVHFQQLRAYAGNAGLSWYAVVAEEEIDQAALQKRFRGTWTMVARMDSIVIYRLDS